MIRGSREVFGRAFFVADNGLYEVFSDMSFLRLGTLLTVSGNVSLADNGLQLCIVDGPNGYILTLADNSFGQITSAGFFGADTVTFVDGYFLFNKPNTGQYYITSLYDGFTIDALDFATAEGSPDNLVGVMTVHKEVWLFGTGSIEVVFNGGEKDFPFTRIQGAYIEYGCVAPHSIAKTANTVFWLGQDEYGHGIVWMATGYQPQRISTFPVEFAIQQYGDLTDAVGYTYQEDGHYFYVLNFTAANTTWVYDVNLNTWHERAYWNSTTGEYERHRGQNHIFVFGKHLIGDYQTNKVYEQSMNLFDDDGVVIRRLRSSPHIFDKENLDFIYYDRFYLDIETGIGNENDVDPQITLQWSDDGGHTWSNEHMRSLGKVGEYKKRVIWNMLGRGRDRVFRTITSAKGRMNLIAANVMARKGNS